MAKQWLPPAKIPVTVGRSESGEDGLDRQGPREGIEIEGKHLLAQTKGSVVWAFGQVEQAPNDQQLE